MVESNVLKSVVLIFVRPLCIFVTQLGLFFLLGSWDATLPWWPFQMIITNVVCFFILARLARADGISLKDIYLRPFKEGLPVGKLAAIIRERNYKPRILSVLYDLGLFSVILLSLGLAALKIAGYIDHQIQAAELCPRYEALPHLAVFAISILLPVTMPLVEVPWYFGYFFPRLERILEGKGKKTALLYSFAVSTFIFSLQHCFQPFVPDWGFIGLRFLMLLPLLALIAWVIRIIPRFMPYILFLHALMAIDVALKYWKFL